MCMYTYCMRERINFWIDLELRDGLNTVKERDGVSESEQIRRGIKMYLESKGLKLKQRAARKGGKRR